MIIAAEIINQPYAGEYSERIYDNQSEWNSQSWSWIKFTDKDYTEWCGQFRGFPRQVAVSEKHNSVLVLTSDYLFQLDKISANLVELERQPQYHNLTTAPSGDFIIADYYNLEKISERISKKVKIESPIQTDMIEFKQWIGTKLIFTCDEFTNWDRHLEMQLDCETFEVTIKRDNIT